MSKFPIRVSLLIQVKGPPSGLELTRFDRHGFMGSGHHESGFIVKRAEITESCLGPLSVVEDLDVVEQHAAQSGSVSCRSGARRSSSVHA